MAFDAKERGIPMGMIVNLISAFTNARVSIGDLFDKILNFFTNVLALDILAPLKGILDIFFAGALKPFAFVLLGLVVACFGQKLIGVGKYVFAALLGFGFGYIYAAAIIGFVPALLLGLAGAVVCVILNRFVYLGFLAAVSAYPVYYFLYIGASSSLMFAYKNLVICAAAALAFAFGVIIFRKSIVEKAGTAFLGAYLTVYHAVSIFDPRSLGILEGDTILYVLMLVIAAVGFVIQVKTRKRY